MNLFPILVTKLAFPNFHSYSPDPCVHADGLKNRSESNEFVGPRNMYK